MKLPLPAQEIINKLQDQITPERQARIDHVVSRRTSQMAVVIEDIYDRGNASAVMRSAEAFGFHQFHMIELQEKFKESKRVTQGAHKWLDINKWKNTKECVENLKKQGRKIYVTHLSETAKPISEVSTEEPFALCFGNEKHGASDELIQLADETVFIPMEGFVQSFNISVAAAIGFYHFRQRLQKSLSEQQKLELKAQYFMTSVPYWEKYL